MKLFVWDRNLPNNYMSDSTPDGLSRGASAIIMARSVAAATRLLEKRIRPLDVTGPSSHYQRMAAAMSTTAPTSETPIITPGRASRSQIIFLAIGTYAGDSLPLSRS